ncbi:hypothetical protein [Massilia aerilata]|uniref:HEAT repeat domain-containing protein n=1 Tax=Massilia aerilata TaxID=453817 RepID=A0ABW0RTL0_9BURK
MENLSSGFGLFGVNSFQRSISSNDFTTGVGKTLITSFSWSPPNSSANTTNNTSNGSPGKRSNYISGNEQTKALLARQAICDEAIKEFIETSRQENFEYGYTPPSERFIHEFAKEHPMILADLIQGILLAESKSSTVMVALMNAIGSMRYEDIRPYGQTTALAAITNQSVEVKEAAIRAYETWGHPEGAHVLSTVDCPWPWLDDYRKQVIEDLGAA